MNAIQKNSISAVTVVLLLGLGGCSNLSEKEQNTAIGAGAGGVAGGVMTGGSTIGILGGAAAGGFLGHILTDDDEDKK
jgi:osmotically inducible lipoprotein OsmB